MEEAIIKCENLGKKYRIGNKVKYIALRDTLVNAIVWPYNFVTGKNRTKKSEIWALRGASLEITKGEVVGVIGGNGAGKTTLLKILSKITEPTEGQAIIKGRVSSLLEVGTGFHDELTGRENVYLNGAILGMKKKEIEKKFDKIVEFSGVERFLDTPMKRYSSGMKVRLAFSVAAHLEPEILLVDEVLAVGDIEFQKKCLGKMDEVVKKSGRTILFVSHNMGAIQSLCSRCILIDKGRLVIDSTPREAIDLYLNEYQKKQNKDGVGLETTEKEFQVERFCFDHDFFQGGFNDPLRLNLELNLLREYSNVIIGIAIVNSIGAKIITSRCLVPQINRGKRVISLQLNDHHLPPGRYLVNININILGASILYLEHAISFELPTDKIDDAFLIQRQDKIGAFIPSQYEIK